MDDLQHQCDEAKRELANKRRILETAGFKLQSQDEDIEHAKKIKRIYVWATKHGGMDQLQKLLNFQDKHIKHKYLSILSDLCISPQDVVAFESTGQKKMSMFGVVLAEPKPSAPYEVHLQVCGYRTYTTIFAPARAELYEVLTTRNVDQLMARVFSNPNMTTIRPQLVGMGSTNVEMAEWGFQYQMTSMATILQVPQYKKIRGQINSWMLDVRDRHQGGDAREQRRANAVELDDLDKPAAAPTAAPAAAPAAAPTAVASDKALGTIHTIDGVMTDGEVVTIEVPPQFKAGDTFFFEDSTGRRFKINVPSWVGTPQLVNVALG